jgi:hypothetical protein
VTILGRMWEHWAWIMSVLCMSTQVLGQCYKSREVGGILKDATRLTRQINVEAMRNEILLRVVELVESMPHCKSITTADGQTPLCVVKDLLTCMNFGGEFAPDELELFNSVENEWREHIFPSDLILTNDFCYLTINTKPIINKKETCYALVDLIKAEIGIGSNFADHRLVIQDKSLTGVQDDVLGQSLCHQTAYLLAEKQSDLILLRKLGQAFDKITEIIKMVGLTIRNSECGDVNFGHFTTEQILCFKRELQEPPTRSKRSTLLNLLLGDGARTDTIQNKVHDMTSVINDNSLKLYNNQEQLKLVSLSNGNSIIELEKRTLFSEAVTLASIHHIEKSLQRQIQNELSFIANNGLSEEITEAHLEISVFAAILSQVLLQEQQFCTSLNTGFGCIQLNDSFVQVKGQWINLDLKVRYLEKTDFYLISCQPRMSDSSISIFHNNHAKIQANHLQIKEFLISEEHLKLDKEEHRSLNEDDYYLENMIFTFDEHKIGLTCKKPELLFTSGNQRFNCTPVITWLTLSEGLEIHSVRGSITHSETRQPHLTKKSQFLQNYEKLDGNIDNLEIIKNTNKTASFHKIWLERLQRLTPLETAAVSLGSGAAILITLFFLICIWKINFQCCRRKQSGESNTTERNHPSREEVLQRSQSILEGYLDRLRRGSTTRPQPEQ